ncbi:hypothetical protein [Candidatus Leptofilum sp.]|uniref:hypothetical protein n=1 Tax=Candidatus Leptofilum sp. TaxID=3241576 RepID=UPI003B5BCB24
MVEGGQKITIAPEKTAAETRIRLFLLGTAASLLLHQRGLLPLHASGIRTPKGAVLFAGHSGYGKSTLLATFVARGYGMLTDDLAAISFDEAERPYVHPSYPHLKLWADSAKKLNKPTESLSRIRPELAKFSVPAELPLAKDPLPLHAVYALTPQNEPEVRLEQLHDARKFNLLLDHTWQKMALKRMGRHVAHFKQAVATSNYAKIVRVYRPDEPFQPHALADRLEADFLS